MPSPDLEDYNDDITGQPLVGFMDGLPGGIVKKAPLTKPVMLDFFNDIDLDKVKKFQRCWNLLAHGSFDATELTFIIKQLADISRPFYPHFLESPFAPFYTHVKENLSLWTDRFIEKSAFFSPSEMADCVIALKDLRIKPSFKFKEEWVRQAEAKLPFLTASELAESFRSFSMNKSHVRGNNFLRCWQDSARAKINDFNARELASSLLCFAARNVRPDQDFLDMWTARAETITRSFRLTDLANSMSAFAMLGLTPDPEFAKQWFIQLKKKLRGFEFDIQDLNRGVKAMGILSCCTGDDLYEMAYDLLEQKIEECGQVNHAHRAQIFPALWFDRPTHHNFQQNEKEVASPDELNLKQAFEKAGVAISQDVLLPKLGRNADIRLTVNDRDIMVEYDGLNHFVEDMDGNLFYDGESRMQNALIAKLYPDTVMVRISSIDAMVIRNQAGDDEIARQLTEAFTDVAPGVYETTIENDRLALIPVLRQLDGPV